MLQALLQRPMLTGWFNLQPFDAVTVSSGQQRVALLRGVLVRILVPRNRHMVLQISSFAGFLIGSGTAGGRLQVQRALDHRDVHYFPVRVARSEFQPSKVFRTYARFWFNSLRCTLPGQKHTPMPHWEFRIWGCCSIAVEYLSCFKGQWFEPGVQVVFTRLSS